MRRNRDVGIPLALLGLPLSLVASIIFALGDSAYDLWATVVCVVVSLALFVIARRFLKLTVSQLILFVLGFCLWIFGLGIAAGGLMAVIGHKDALVSLVLTGFGATISYAGWVMYKESADEIRKDA